MASVLHRSKFQDGKSRTAQFEGASFGTPVSFFLVDNDPGQGPGLHDHAYAETWIVQSGNVIFQISDEVISARAGEIVVIPPLTPHKFTNAGPGRLEMTCIHASGHIIQRDFEESAQT